MNFKYTKHQYLTREEYEVIDQGLAAHSLGFHNFKQHKSFAFLAKNDKYEVIGGCYGSMFYGSLHLDQIWVSPDHRHSGIGSKLIHLSEELAKKEECTVMTLTTMSWEAPQFYKKLGFKLNGTADGYVNNAERYFFSKKIKLNF